MLGYAVRRVVLLLPTLLGMAIVTFFLLLLIPGDPARVLLGPDAAADVVAQMRVTLGLDLPWYVRLGRYLLGLLHGDLGRSIFESQSVARLIGDRLGATLELAVAAMLVALAMGISLGVVAAVRRGGAADVLAMLVAQLGVSMPVYWLGIMLVLGFAVQLNWLPAIGRGPALTDAVAALFTGDAAPLGQALQHIVLPAFALGIGAAAIISRVVRASLLETLSADFVRTGYAKGLRTARVVLVHALPNAMLPIISVIGLRFGALLGGAVLTETIFNWPGLGQLVVTAILQRDIPLVQGVVLVFALLYALTNLAVDLLYTVIDPRVRLG
jgi:ABC-type dipeptide/oligopeptide/nickel transport system permease component